MTEPHDDDLAALLDAARADRPASADDARLERRVLGAIAAGTVATTVPAGKVAAILRFLAGNPFVSLALLAVGAMGAGWIATHDARTFLAPPRSTHSQPAISTPPPARSDVRIVPAVSPSAPEPQPVQPTAPTAARVPTSRGQRGTTPTHPAPRASSVVENPLNPPPVGVPMDVQPGVVRVEDAPRASSEVGLLARARAALRQSDARGALAAIAEHDARYPSGQFSEELDVLRVEALAGSGRAAEARARAAQFGRQWPGSTYAERVRRAVGTPGAP